MENLTYLFAAYISIWIVIFAFVIRLISREKELSRQVEILRLELAEKRQGGSHDDMSSSG